MTDDKRKKTSGLSKPKPGKTYKQYRDETTGRFISQAQAERQARSGNVMTHRVERRSRSVH